MKRPGLRDASNAAWPVPAVQVRPSLLLGNEIALRVLVNEQNAVLRSGTSVTVKAHARLKHVRARRHGFLIAAVERVLPCPGQIYRVVVARVRMDRSHEPGG